MKEKDLEMVKNSLLTVLCNATGIFRRTVDPKDKEFKIKLEKTITKLRKQVNLGSIKNGDIRRAIKELSSATGYSVGASQKPINVYLKFYAVLSSRKNILRELDCPIDSYVIKKNGLKRISLKKLNFEDYEEMQNTLYKKYNGTRILADILSWDIKKQY